MNLVQTYKTAFGSVPDKNQQLKFLLILIFIGSLPFNIFYSNIALVSVGLITFLNFRTVHIKTIPNQFWIFQAVFYLGVIAYFYSFHKAAAGFLLERQLVILLFPIAIPLIFEVNKRNCDAILFTFSLFCFLAVLYLLGKMVVGIIALHIPFTKAISTGIYFNHGFSRPINIHAGYLSLFVAFSILFLFSKFRSASGGNRFSIAAIILILFIGILFLASRNVMLALLFIVLFIYPYFYVARKIRFYTVSFVTVLILILSIQRVPYLKERFSVQLVSDIKSLNKGQVISYSATEPRIERWKCAWTLISKSPVFGYGTGDEIPMLKTEYMRKGLFISYVEGFNAHNEYLSYLLKNGWVGLLLFLCVFAYYIRLAVKRKLFIYVGFLLLLLIGFYTENILDANKGIYFFAFFNTLLGYLCLNKFADEPPASMHAN